MMLTPTPTGLPVSESKTVYVEIEGEVQISKDYRSWPERFKWLLQLLDSDIYPLTPLGPTDRTNYLHALRRAPKSKGGKPPVDYVVAELRVDFERALDGLDYPSAIRNYWRILYLINPDPN